MKIAVLTTVGIITVIRTSVDTIGRAATRVIIPARVIIVGTKGRPTIQAASIKGSPTSQAASCASRVGRPISATIETRGFAPLL